jgi:hypothetical protein
MRWLFAVLVLSATAAVAADQQSTKVNGWISDSMCAQKHAGKPAVSCVKKCIEMGSKPVFVDDAKKQVWAIDNPDAVTAHYGHHVSITGMEDSSAKSIHINKVTMLSDQGGGGTY